MSNELTFSITTTRFDEHYAPSPRSRLTTNFANLARGPHRRDNLRTALAMIDRRCNELAPADNAQGERYRVELDIVSAELRFTADGAPRSFPFVEMLDVTIIDRHTGARHAGIVGNNFSSYLRDYDFSVRLPDARRAASDTAGAIPADFGALHGALFRHFLDSAAYRERFTAHPVVCISVSTSRSYRRVGEAHAVLGVEYVPDARSLTDDYFAAMGLRVRAFMPPGSVAPLAFYSGGDVTADYSELQLVGTIATMETFQQIYRPEIYAASTAAGDVYRPSLEGTDYVTCAVSYDRVERRELATQQGRYTEEHLVRPYGRLLDRWAAEHRAALVA